MITLKFTANGNSVEAQADSFTEAAGLLSSLTKTVEKKAPAATKKAPVSRKGAQFRSWTMDEIRTIYRNPDVKARHLMLMPELRGRTKASIQTARSLIFRNGGNAEKASANLRKMVQDIQREMHTPAPHTGLLD